MFKKFKAWLLKKELKWYQDQIAQLRKERDHAREQKAKYYGNWLSASGEIWPLKRKLERSRKWNQKTHEALKKLKEQSRLDHEYAEQQKRKIEDLKAEIAHLWEGKEETEVIKVSPPIPGEAQLKRCRVCNQVKNNIRVDIWGLPCDDCYQEYLASVNVGRLPVG